MLDHDDLDPETTDSGNQASFVLIKEVGNVAARFNLPAEAGGGLAPVHNDLVEMKSLTTRGSVSHCLLNIH